jgi:fructose transport system permease protein
MRIAGIPYQTLAVGILIILAVSIDQWIRKVKS